MRATLLAVALAFVASAASALWLWNELREERATSSALRVELANRTPLAPPADTHAARTSPARAAAPAAAKPASPEVSPESPRVVHGTREEWDTYQRRLLQDPKFREARRQELLIDYRNWRDGAVNHLGFTVAEADAVIATMVERQLRTNSEPTPTINFTPEARRALKAELEARERAYQDELRQIVGEDKRQRWQTYLDSLPSRGRVDSLRAQLSGADALREDQVEPLITALHTERAQMRRELEEFNETLDWSNESALAAGRTWETYSQRQIDLLIDANRRALAAASGILSPAQLKRLANTLQRDVDREVAQRRTVSLRNRLDAATTPPD